MLTNVMRLMPHRTEEVRINARKFCIVTCSNIVKMKFIYNYMYMYHVS